MNYEFNLLHHAGVVAKRLRAAAVETAAGGHEGDDNTPSGPTGRRVKSRVYFWMLMCDIKHFSVKIFYNIEC